MTMDAMVRYLGNSGFKAKREYDSSTKSYRFTIERGGSYLVRHFKWLNCDKPWLHQEQFLKSMVEDFERAEKEMMTVDDMRHYLVTQGIAAMTYDHKNCSGEHEVIFIVMRRGRSLRRILNEYNIGGLTEIQRHRRDFLKEIIEAFEYEEKLEALRYINNDIMSTQHIRDIYTEEKEQMNMANIEFKVTNITIDRRLNETPEIAIEVKAYPDPITYIDPMKLTDIINAKLNGLFPKNNPLTPSTKLPAIEKVIFNDPATIIIWKDGTKTVVKAHNDAYDPEKGFAMAVTKKALGNEGNYFETVKKWVGDVRVDPDHSAKWLATQRLYNALGDKKATKADLKFAMEEAIKYLEGDK